MRDSAVVGQIVTPATQLEIAAQWLREGAIALRGKAPAAD